MQLATKTLAAIETALVIDQGAKFRGFLAQTMPQAGDAYSTKEDPFRAHLGASLIGRECGRELWYSFHWATKKQFDGRILRLFNRGHLEEPRFVALLLMIGCQVYQVDANGKQFRIVGHRGHFGGSLDAVVVGLPDIPDEPVLAEFKTHGDKSFAALVDNGVVAAKYEHFVQMQIYMGKSNLRWALYCAVNKNDDSVHMEIVAFDQTTYDRYLARSAIIIDSADPLPKINNSPAWFKCKFCDHKAICHQNVVPEKNCRTCRWALIGNNGTWICTETMYNATRLDPVLSTEQQFRGCGYYELSLVFKK